MNLKEELKRLLIECAYSSKGHFKTADWMRLSLAALVVVPLVTSLIQAFFSIPEPYSTALSFIGLLFSCFALVSVLASNSDRAQQLVAEHIELGNQYLRIFKEMRISYCDAADVEEGMLRDWQERISDLDVRTSTAPISFIGRTWSSLRVVGEMDLGWLVE